MCVQQIIATYLPALGLGALDQNLVGRARASKKFRFPEKCGEKRHRTAAAAARFQCV